VKAEHYLHHQPRMCKVMGNHLSLQHWDLNYSI